MKKKKLKTKSRIKAPKKKVVKKRKSNVNALIKAFVKVYSTPVR